MSDQQQTASGADLARQALAGYRANAKSAPAAKKKPRPVRRPQGDGRDPVGFGSVLARLNQDQDWRIALDGGSIIDRWATLCPQYAGHIQPVAFNAERGCLDLRPASHVYAAQLRMLGPQLCKQINDKLGRVVVQRLRVLPVGVIDSPTGPPVQDSPDASPAPGPVRTRDAASPGYHRALQAHREHQADGLPTNPFLEAARIRQDQALAAPANREPAEAFTAAMTVLEDLATGQADDRAEQVHRAALAEAQRQKAGAGSLPRRAFDAA